MKTSEFARLFGVSEMTVKRLVRKGFLNPKRGERRVFLFSDSDMEAMQDYLSPPEGMMDRNDIALRFGVTLATVNKWAEDGKIKADGVKKGKHYYRPEQLEKLK